MTTRPRPAPSTVAAAGRSGNGTRDGAGRARGGASTVEKGRDAEDRAAAELSRRGYVVLARNARTRRGEIDLVAKDGDVLVFVEVRSRADDRYGEAKATVGRAKQARVAAAAGAWLARLPPPWPICRFDVVAVEGDRVDVLQGAFEAPA